MTESSISDEDLAEFRFQSFYEDVIETTAPQNRESLTERRRRAIPGDPEMLFTRGALREAVGIAALAVASGFFPREAFTRMLEYGDIPTLIAGDIDPSPTESDDGVPYPIFTLPDRDYALALSQAELELEDPATQAVSEMVATYTSLARQIDRANYLRRFNAELLFASTERWESEVQAFADSARAWIERRVDMGEAIWPAEGLDSYFDFAEDLGATVVTEPSGAISAIRIPPVLSDDDGAEVDILAQALFSRSLLPITGWRFGGPSGSSFSDLVIGRINELQLMVSTVSVAVYTEGRWRVRPEIRARFA